MLQQLFASPILSVQTLHPSYEDHASDVFLVQTKDEEVIVRSSKMTEEPNNDFWWGMQKPFWNRSKERTSFRIYTRIIEKAY